MSEVVAVTVGVKSTRALLKILGDLGLSAFEPAVVSNIVEPVPPSVLCVNGGTELFVVSAEATSVVGTDLVREIESEKSACLLERLAKALSQNHVDGSIVVYWTGGVVEWTVRETTAEAFVRTAYSDLTVPTDGWNYPQMGFVYAIKRGC